MAVVIERPGRSTVYEIGHAVYHPLFNANTRANNLVLLKVDTPITTVPNVVEPAVLKSDTLRGGATLALTDTVEASVS